MRLSIRIACRPAALGLTALCLTANVAYSANECGPAIAPDYTVNCNGPSYSGTITYDAGTNPLHFNLADAVVLTNPVALVFNLPVAPPDVLRSITLGRAIFDASGPGSRLRVTRASSLAVTDSSTVLVSNQSGTGAVFDFMGSNNPNPTVLRYHQTSDGMISVTNSGGTLPVIRAMGGGDDHDIDIRIDGTIRTANATGAGSAVAVARNGSGTSNFTLGRTGRIELLTGGDFTGLNNQAVSLTSSPSAPANLRIDLFGKVFVASIRSTTVNASLSPMVTGTSSIYLYEGSEIIGTKVNNSLNSNTVVGSSANSGGAAYVYAAGKLEITGRVSYGIQAANTNIADVTVPPKATIELDSTARISVTGLGSTGVYSTVASTILNKNFAESTVRGVAGARVITSAESSVAIRARSPYKSTVEYNGVAHAEGQFGVGIWSEFSPVAQITIGQEAEIKGGWQADTTSSGIGARKAAAIDVGSQGNATIDVYGQVSAGSDRLVRGTSGNIEINNYRSMVGFFDLAGAVNTKFVNHGGRRLTLRHLADTDGDQTRDTKRVAISDFGTGVGSFDNAVGALVKLGVANAGAVVDSTDFYRAAQSDASVYDFSRDGLYQAQLVNLDRFVNAGAIDLRGDVIGNSLAITGAASMAAGPSGGVYQSNGGRLLINVNFGNSAGYSDMLVVDQTENGTGATTIAVDRRLGKSPEDDGNGILVVEVRDKSDGASSDEVFALQGDFEQDGQQLIVHGAKTFGLYHNGIGADSEDGNWYLRYVGLSPNLDIYENVPGQLRSLVSFSSTAIDRIGLQTGNGRVSTPDLQDGCTFGVAASAGSALTEGAGCGGFWFSGLGGLGRSRANGAGDEARLDYRRSGFQSGLGGVFHETETGSFAVGARAYYMNSSASMEIGKQNFDSYGLGGSLSYFDDRGFYVNVETALTLFRADFSSSISGELASGIDGKGYGFSLESGWTLDAGNGWSFTPQAQISYKRASLDKFTDSLGVSIDARPSESIEVRGGLYTRYDNEWRDEQGASSKLRFYAGLDLISDFKNKDKVIVSDMELDSEYGRYAFGLAMGVEYLFNDQKHAFYAQASSRSSFKDRQNNYDLSGEIGFRLRW